jgi:hypothetical protein
VVAELLWVEGPRHSRMIAPSGRNPSPPESSI